MSNSKERILILSPFFYPELISTGKFNTDLAIALKDRGKDVTIICSHPFYPEWKPKKSSQSIEGIKIIRGGNHIRYLNNTTIRRIILEVWYAFYILRKIVIFRNRTDIIIPIFPPSLAFYIILPFVKRRIVKIGMVHDLQKVYASNKEGLIHKVISFFINKVEKRVFQACDRLIFLSNEMKEAAKVQYTLNENILDVQYPFVNLDLDCITNELAPIFSNTKEHVVYSGALGEKQNAEKVYEFYDFASTKIKNVEFHFFSQGNIFESLKKKNKNENIKFHNLVPERNVLELYKKSTIQIIPQKEGTSKGSLPSKLPNILASGCNILIITDKNSELDTLFKKYSLNTVVNLWDNQVLCSALKKILDSEKDNKIHQKVANDLFNMSSMIDKILS